MDEPAERAIIYLRGLGPCHDRCVAHCKRKRYRVVGVIVDPAGSRWSEAVEAGFAGQCEVVVYCPGDLPPDRVPRMEAATEPAGVTSRRRRPRRR